MAYSGVDCLAFQSVQLTSWRFWYFWSIKNSITYWSSYFAAEWKNICNNWMILFLQSKMFLVFRWFDISFHFIWEISIFWKFFIFKNGLSTVILWKIKFLELYFRLVTSYFYLALWNYSLNNYASSPLSRYLIFVIF